MPNKQTYTLKWNCARQYRENQQTKLIKSAIKFSTLIKLCIRSTFNNQTKQTSFDESHKKHQSTEIALVFFSTWAG